MTIFDLYSKRKRREQGDIPDVYAYDEIPVEFRTQVVLILAEAVGPNKTDAIANQVLPILRKEYGLFRLAGEFDEGHEELVNHFLATDTNRALDVIELSFCMVDKVIRRNILQFMPDVHPDDAIKELNERFREAALGYQYESGRIVRVDSQYVHSEAVKPALTILADPDYEGANEEFRLAHDHYRAGRFKESINDCLKCLESTLKSICSTKGWDFHATDSAKALIDIALDNGILPKFMQSQLGTFRSLLQSGIPTVRNKLSGHGQGETTVPVPPYLCSYVLHLTATTVLLLAEAAGDD